MRKLFSAGSRKIFQISTQSSARRRRLFSTGKNQSSSPIFKRFLFRAVRKSHLYAVETMIAAGAEVDIANIQGGDNPVSPSLSFNIYLIVLVPGETSVHEACKAGDLSVARLVLTHSSRPHCLTGQGYQGVHLAAQVNLTVNTSTIISSHL